MARDGKNSNCGKKISQVRGRACSVTNSPEYAAKIYNHWHIVAIPLFLHITP